MSNGRETVLDKNAFLVSETDAKGIIKFANEDFCKIAGYSLSELIGNPHNMVRHSDMPKKAFKSLWDTVQKGNIWTGYVKNATKDGDIIGYLQLFIHLRVVMVQWDTFLVEKNLQMKKFKKLKCFINNGKKKRDKIERIR